MMRKNTYHLILALLLNCMLNACKEKYSPELPDVNPNYFVVEGLINVGADSTIFTLSRTYKLDKKAVVVAEKGAIVQVESDAGDTYVLPELIKSGSYGRPPLNLDITRKYRLRVRTKDNREYLSDFVESKPSPPIDAVTYDFRNGQLNVYANTHDPSGKSRYYVYNYIETSQYMVPLRSYFKIVNHEILLRRFPEDDIYNCWRNYSSTNISLGSTTSLTEDRLADKLITSVTATSPKRSYGYSILVEQRVLTKQGFEFWEALYKNTEQVGSIFDAQPSQLPGNIHNTVNVDEVVIGFVTASTVTSKRLTLSVPEMPDAWRPVPVDSMNCGQDKKYFRFGAEVQRNLLTPDKPDFVPLDFYPDNGPALGYAAINRLECVDCRVLGGTNVRPPYWK